MSKGQRRAAVQPAGGPFFPGQLDSPHLPGDAWCPTVSWRGRVAGRWPVCPAHHDSHFSEPRAACGRSRAHCAQGDCVRATPQAPLPLGNLCSGCLPMIPQTAGAAGTTGGKEPPGHLAPSCPGLRGVCSAQEGEEGEEEGAAGAVQRRGELLVPTCPLAPTDAATPRAPRRMGQTPKQRCDHKP